jgi:hypothetical protein
MTRLFLMLTQVPVGWGTSIYLSNMNGTNTEHNNEHVHIYRCFGKIITIITLIYKVCSFTATRYINHVSLATLV